MSERVDFQKKLFAEFIGTFLLVFIGCGTAAVVAVKDNNFLAVAMAFGLILAVLVYMFGNISAAFNPAVSLAMAVDGQISASDMLMLWVAQIAGALGAAGILAYLLGAISSLGQSIGTFTTEAPWKAVTVETIITFILTITILIVGGDKKYAMVSGLAIGFALLLGVLFGGSLSGGSMNPARSLGPFTFRQNLQYMWIYIVGPFLGALIGVFVYRYFVPKQKCRSI